MILQSFKCMGRLIVRSKAIKYKKNFFCYLSFYPNLGLQAACFQILSFSLYIFRSFFLSRKSLEFLTKYICLSLGSQIHFNNLNFILYTKFFINQIPKARMAVISQLFFCYCIKLQFGQFNTREPYLLYLTSCTLITYMAIPKA